MPWKNTGTQYGCVSKILHWLMGILVIVMLPVGLFMDNIPDKALKMQVFGIHKIVGLSLLLLFFIRVLWRIGNVRPASLNAIRWQKVLEANVHYALYLLLFLMPMSGWVMSTAAGHPVAFLGQLWSAPFIPVDKAIASTAHNIHEYAGYLLILLLILHIGAALKHHFIDKDNVLKRMCCGKK